MSLLASCLLAPLFLALQGCSPEAAACSAASVEVDWEAGTRQLVAYRRSIDWQSCPSSLPATCRMAVLEGDPSVAQLYTMRFVTEEALSLPLHVHPKNERVTVLTGTVFVAFPDGQERAFSAGDYYVNRAGVPHSVWSEGPVSVQITGIGPWVVEPVERQGIP